MRCRYAPFAVLGFVADGSGRIEYGAGKEARALLECATALGALVQQIGLGNVALAEPQALANLWSLATLDFDGQYCIQIGALGKCVACVVHNRIIIVGHAQRINLIHRQHVKIVVLPLHYIVVLNHHVLLAIRARVLVPEAHHVTQFMHHNAKLVAVTAN